MQGLVNKTSIFTGVLLIVIIAVMLISKFTINNESEIGRVENTSAADLFSKASTTTDSIASTTASSELNKNTNTKNMSENPKVTIETNKGVITLELFASDAPKAVANFTNLASKGFYDGVIFHRVIEGFMIQGGDPTGTGRGGPGYTFADELNPQTASYKNGYKRGVLAMANAGPNTNGSQFFIMHKDNPLPHNYTIFGQVTQGIEVVDAIASSDTDPSDRPLVDVVMKSVKVSK